MKLLLVDSNPARRCALANVLRCIDGFGVDDKAHESTLGENHTYECVVFHENNWSATSGSKNFIRSLNSVPFIRVSGGHKETVLLLEKGDEYSSEQWEEALKNYVSDKNLDAFMKSMYRTQTRKLLETLAPLCIVKDQDSVIRDKVTAGVKKTLQKIVVKDFWKVCEKQCDTLQGIQDEIQKVLDGEASEASWLSLCERVTEVARRSL